MTPLWPHYGPAMTPAVFACMTGLPIKLNVNNGQNKFEVDILKNVAKIANFRPTATFFRDLSICITHFLSFFIRSFLFNCLFFRDESNGDKIKAISFLV